MSLKEYPYLRSLHEEIGRLLIGEPPRAASRAGPVRFVGGRDIALVRYPGLGDYWLTPPQVLVVRELLSALMFSRSPDVDQGHLLKVSGTGAKRLRDVFARSPAWGELVIPGSQAGTYRAFGPAAEEVGEEDPNGEW